MFEKYKNEQIHAPVCSCCHAVKTKVNNWWQVMESNGSLIIRPIDDNPNAGLSESQLYLCGKECVLKVATDYMNDKIGVKLDVSVTASLVKPVEVIPEPDV